MADRIDGRGLLASDSSLMSASGAFYKFAAACYAGGNMFPENNSICPSVKTLFTLWQKASLGHMGCFLGNIYGDSEGFILIAKTQKIAYDIEEGTVIIIV